MSLVRICRTSSLALPLSSGADAACKAGPDFYVALPDHRFSMSITVCKIVAGSQVAGTRTTPCRAQPTTASGPRLESALAADRVTFESRIDDPASGPRGVQADYLPRARRRQSPVSLR